MIFAVWLCNLLHSAWQLLCVLCAQPRPTLCGPVDCSPPGSSVHGISLVRMLEQAVLCFSRSSSWPRDQTQCLLPLLNRKVNSLPLHCMGRTDGLWVHPYCYKWHYFIIFYWWIISSCMYVPHLVYPCLCWWTFRVLSGPGCCKECWNEHWGACIFSNYGFLSMYIPRMGLLDHMITLFSVF